MLQLKLYLSKTLNHVPINFDIIGIILQVVGCMVNCSDLARKVIIAWKGLWADAYQEEPFVRCRLQVCDTNITFFHTVNLNVIE